MEIRQIAHPRCPKVEELPYHLFYLILIAFNWLDMAIPGRAREIGVLYAGLQLSEMKRSQVRDGQPWTTAISAALGREHKIFADLF